MEDSVNHAIEKLSGNHCRDDFDCGQQWLNQYLRRHAMKNEELGYGRTYVAVRRGCSSVDGFFTLSMSSVMFQNLPDSLATSAPRYPMPVAHLGCLAVRTAYQGKGLGGILLIESFRRIIAASELVAARAMEVKAIDDQARQWYLRRGFLPFNDHQEHLYLPLDTIRAALAEADG